MRRCRAFVLSCIRKKLAVEASAGYSFFFKFLLRKCGNIWNLCEVSPARLTEKCLYHYNGYDVDFMQNFTKPAVGEKKNMTKRQKRFLALMLGAVLLGDCAAHTGTMISGLSSVYAATGSATVNATTLNVRSTPGTTGSIVKKLAYGAAVTVVSETTGSDGKIWYKIQFSSSSGTQGGYVRSDYIKFPVSYSYDANFESYLNSQGFPESYKTSLRTLHTEHPTWVFQGEHFILEIHRLRRLRLEYKHLDRIRRFFLGGGIQGHCRLLYGSEKFPKRYLCIPVSASRLRQQYPDESGTYEPDHGNIPGKDAGGDDGSPEYPGDFGVRYSGSHKQ